MKRSNNKMTFLKRLNGFSLVNMLLIVIAIGLTVAKVDSILVISVLLLAVVSDFIGEDMK